MAPAEGSEADVGRAARAGAGGVVSRPALFDRLGASARVTVVSAPPGSGKTVLLRSWIGETGLADCAAWVLIGRDERDPQRFWLSVLRALRQTTPGSALVQAVTAAPDLDGWAITERLLKDLAPLADRVWLVIDDVHELGAAEAGRQLELLLMRAPPELHFVLSSRHDLRLGLHRLRLEGKLTEIRAADLRFTLDEARQLFRAAGVKLSDAALVRLHERTEGWAAGLRLAALSLSRHPDPERFAAEFSGSERTVAEYLVAEALERHSSTRLEAAEDLRALALVNLGIAELWAARFEEAGRHLKDGVALARRIGRPYLQFIGLAHQAVTELVRSFARAAERSREAIELAEQHGWTDVPAAGIAYQALGGALVAHLRLEEAEGWIRRAERTVRPEAEPAAALLVRFIRGLLELARGRDADALAALRAAERLAGHLAAPHYLALPTQAWLLQALVRLGELEQAEQALADLGDQDRDRGELRIAAAALRLAQHDPHAAGAALAPVLDGAGTPPAAPPGGPQPPLDPLSDSEIRVLRYLPTNLSAAEIANELSVSPNTVKTHIHNLYLKLGTHRRGEAVARARALGLLAPAPRRR
jgi:ATP/maltotriose-dependent transcriptional regulator MalT